MGRIIRKRSIAAAIAAVAMTVLGAPAAAGAATATYPAGGSGFTGGMQGWTGSGQSCAPVQGADITCSTTAEHSATVGNPAGSINSRITTLVNAGGLLKGETTFTSPDFTLAAGSGTRSGAVALDRRIDGGGVALGPESTYEVSLIDRGAGGTATKVLSETIDETDSAFARQAAPVPAGALVPGRTYALVIKTTTQTRTARAGLLGDLNTRYDNVGLSVEDSQLPPGVTPIGDGALGSPGVTVRDTSVTDRALAVLLGSINVNAEVGRGPGGSVVPLAKCTIVGTPKNDRIVGTKGNDVICGLGGNDTIDGAGGNDIADTANGNDRAKGGTGKDALIGVRGRDRLSGLSGNDRMGGGASPDRLNGGRSSDRVHGGSGNDRLAGASGNDRLNGSKGGDLVRAGSGRDLIAARIAAATGSTADPAGTGRPWTAAVAARRARASRPSGSTAFAGSSAFADVIGVPRAAGLRPGAHRADLLGVWNRRINPSTIRPTGSGRLRPLGCCCR